LWFRRNDTKVQATLNFMMNTRKAIQFLFILPSIFLFSCAKQLDRSPSSVDTAVHVMSLTIDATEFVLLPASTRQLSVNFTPANADNRHLSWSDAAIATVNTSGLVTTIRAGTANIIAMSEDNGSVQGIARLNVLNDFDVYAAGSGFTPDFSGVALYWKNGVKSGLPGGYLVGSNAFAIFLVGNDVYIAGNTLNSNFWDIPTYWKNGVPHVVGDATVSYNSYTKAIAVDNNKVYVAGYSYFSSECPTYCFGRTRASYFSLCDSISATSASGIALNGNDIIVTGAQTTDNTYRWSTFWKNDLTNAMPLTTPSGTSTFDEATAVKLHGTDLFFTGYTACGDYGCVPTAKLWKNNMNNVIEITDGTKAAKAYCVAFSGDTIYVGGYENNEAGKRVAKYWKIANGHISSRTLSDGTIDTEVDGIDVAGNDIFLIGTQITDVGSSTAKCWRAYEGFPTGPSLDLSDFYVRDGYTGSAICVK